MEIYHETALERAFHFTPDDLRENRRGQLSGTQIDRLRRRAGRTAWIILGILGVLAVLTLVSANVTPTDVPLFALCLLVPALVTLAFTIGVTEVAINPRVVTKRTGQIHLAAAPFGYEPPLDPVDMNNFPTRRRWIFGNSRSSGAPGSMGQYSMIIGDQQFRLTQEEFQALHPAVYTVYFVPSIQKIVAMELMSPMDTEPSFSPTAEPMLPSPPSPLDDDDHDMLRG